MSKQENFKESDSPPPYSATNPSFPSVSGLLSSHLTNLSGSISSARAERTLERDESDGEVLSLLIPHIEDLIRVAAVESPGRQLEMTMVPEGAVGQDWNFSDEDVKLVKIRHKKDAKTAQGDALWWDDEEVASRLARLLQPERPKSQPTPVEAPKKTAWGLFKRTEPTPVYPPPESRQVPRQEPVSLRVGAEEVTFRRENEMGIWESKTGWGLVVRIRVRQ